MLLIYIYICIYIYIVLNLLFSKVLGITFLAAGYYLFQQKKRTDKMLFLS